MKNKKSLVDKIKHLGEKAFVSTANVVVFGFIGPLAIAKHNASMSRINSYYNSNDLISYMLMDHDKSVNLCNKLNECGHPLENLFIYGGLEDSRILKLSLIFEQQDDILEGYEKFKVKPSILSKSHYLIKPKPDSHVDGLLLRLQPFELEFLDEFYGKVHNRIPVDLKSGEKTWVYSAFRKLQGFGAINKENPY